MGLVSYNVSKLAFGGEELTSWTFLARLTHKTKKEAFIRYRYLHKILILNTNHILKNKKENSTYEN